jgi:ABC-type transport system involved in multi-copper enzyme maturation permease subunit
MRADVIKTISVDWFKAKRQKMTYILPALLVVVAVTMVFVLELAARRNWIGVPDGYFITASVMSWMNNIMVLLVVVFTSFGVAQEFAFGTVKSAWVRPVARSQWYTGKLIFSGGIVTDLFLITGATVFFLVMIRLGYADLMEKNFVVHTSGSLGLRLALVSGLTLWALWAMTAVVGMIASLFPQPGGAIAAGLGLGILMMVMSAFEPIRPFLLTHYVSIPFEQMISMSKGVPLPFEWKQLIIRGLAIPFGWMIITFFIGQRIIRNKEIST